MITPCGILSKALQTRMGLYVMQRELEKLLQETGLTLTGGAAANADEHLRKVADLSDPA